MKPATMKPTTYEYHAAAQQAAIQNEAKAKANGCDHLIAHYQTMAAHHAALAKRIAARIKA